MKTSLMLLARRAALVTKTSPHCTTFVKCLSSKLPLPPEEYINGHLKTDHLEYLGSLLEDREHRKKSHLGQSVFSSFDCFGFYLDDMIEKTLEIEESMAGLKETYGKKKDSYTTIGWTSSADIDRLFETAATQKEELSEQIAELKKIMQKAKSTFAVDAPDGSADAGTKEDMEEVNHIIKDAAEHEDKDKIELQHKMNHAVRKDRARDPEHDW
jgi:hypothetical protein